jgi:hypothetical protein
MALRMALIGLVGALAACQTIKAHHDFDPQAPFATYETFAWVTEQSLIPPVVGAAPGDARRPDPLLDPIIRDAVERNLRARGYEQLRDPNGADLVLSFSLGARDKIEVDSYPVGAGYRYGGWGYGGVYATEVETYTEGILAFDFFDRRTRRAVWHGWATKRLSSSPTPEKRRATVNEVTDAILEKFPYRGAGTGQEQ